MGHTASAPEAFYHDDAFVDFYDLEMGWGTDTRYCAALGEAARSVLDLGCGTGLLAAHLAGDGSRRVVGADPAAAMLRVARARPGGDRVRWVEADARALDLGECFDLIVMTGHAFQCLPTAADRAALFATIRRHLAPAGRFIFDSRNPLKREWLEWTPQDVRAHIHPRHGRLTAWNDAFQDEATGLVYYDTFYRIEESGRLLSTRCALAFPSRQDLEGEIAAAGLHVDTWYGDWEGGACTPAAPEIIPFGEISSQAAI
ncbi:MAG: class I SAM-dependent methyltransferase [Alphaproteobacteria bacterium]|nr:class I SAM-dependent methyltransferase [Alphaproteobacteria bacterium]